MKTKDLVLIGLFAAIVSVLGPLAINIGTVPITLQTFAVSLVGSALGAKRGFYSVLIYVILICIGLPVAANGAGGIHILMGPTGGFIISFPISAYVTGLISEKSDNFFNILVANLVGGILVFFIGVPWLKFNLDLSWSAAYAAGFGPFILAYVIKAFMATFGAKALLPQIKRMENQ